MQAQELLEFLVKNGDIPPERRKELASLIKKPALDENIDANEIEEGNQAEGPSTADPFSRLVDSNLIQKEQRHKMYYGVSREDYNSILDKKRQQKITKDRDGKRREANAPPLDRIPLPSLSDSVKQEYRAAYRDIQLKKHRITNENPPSVCLYTVLNSSNSLCSASIADDGSMFALGFQNSVIQIDTLLSDHLKILKKPDDLDQLDTTEGISLDIYDPQEQPKSMSLVGHSGPVHSVSFSCEKRLLLSGSRDSTIRLWNLEMGRTIVIYRPIAPIWQAQFCSRGYYFAVASADKTVSLWTTDRLKPLRIFTDAQDDVTCIDFHPNCNYITGGSIDNVIRVWDVLSGTCVRSFTGHRGPIRGLKTSHCGRYLVSTSDDGTVAVWDFAQQKMMAMQECEPFEFNSPIVFSREGSVIAIGTPNFGVSFFSLDAATSCSSGQPVIDPPGFKLFSYPTKSTSILDFHFTRKNAVVAIGSFES